MIIIIIIVNKTSELIMLKKSKQRDEILKILLKKNYHPTTEDIYMLVKKKLPNVGIATIYRNLEQLNRIGTVVKIDLPDGAACYDGNVEKHHHIICNECGKVNDVWLDHDITNYVNFKKVIPDYMVTGYRIDFQGKCNKCC